MAGSWSKIYLIKKERNRKPRERERERERERDNRILGAKKVGGMRKGELEKLRASQQSYLEHI